MDTGGCVVGEVPDAEVQACEALTYAEVLSLEEDDLAPREVDPSRPGVGVGDLDGDGDDDVLFAWGGGSFFGWNEGGTLDVSGAKDPPLPHGSSVALADWDEDGDLDVYLGRHGELDVLLENEGGRSFTVASSLLGTSLAPGGAAFGDLDVDFDLDLVVSRTPAVLDESDYLGEDAEGAGVEIWGNDGGMFLPTDRLDELDGSLVWQPSLIDADGDGDLDIYVANDFGALYVPSRLMLNDGFGSFTRAEDCGCELEHFAMSAAVGDPDGDGLPDLWISDLGESDLLQNQGDGSFVDVSLGLGLAWSETQASRAAWGARWLDADRDGCMDLAVVLGQLGSPGVGGPAEVEDAQHDELLLGDCAGGLRFASPRPFGDAHRARALATGDFDGDGREDLVVAGKHYFRVYQAAGGCPTGLSVTLDSEPAIGTRVDVTVGERTTTQWLFPAGTLSSSAPRLVFGLGGAAGADRVDVTWPDGITWCQQGVPAGELSVAYE